MAAAVFKFHMKKSNLLFNFFLTKNCICSRRENGSVVLYDDHFDEGDDIDIKDIVDDKHDVNCDDEVDDDLLGQLS